MPVPIMPLLDNRNDISGIDYSFLLQQPTPKKKTVTASNEDASLLFQLWVGSERSEKGTVKISSDMNISPKDIMRLKTMGFLTGGIEEVKFTKKGKIIITTMALGSHSKFLKNREDKKYTEILASMNKKGKKGFRVPKYASDNTNRLRLN